MEKRIISIFLALAMLISVVPVWAEGRDDTDLNIPYEEDAEPTPNPLNFVREEINPNPTQEPYKNTPIIHTEELPYDIDFSEEDERQLSDELIHPERFLNPGGISTFALEGTSNELWNSFFAEQLGDSYLKPYAKRGGAAVSGSTNRLSIEETDLALPGKNGLDVVIKRKYDNQDYNDSLGYSRQGQNGKNSRYVYSFTNDATNEIINIAFLNPDELYFYMYNGLKIKSIDKQYLRTAMYSNTYINYYEFEKIYAWRSEDGGISLKYNPQIPCKIIADSYTSFSDIGLEHVNIVPNENKMGSDGELGKNWSLIVPELYIYRYELYYGGDSDKRYEEADIIGSFRDIDGNIYTLKGQDQYISYGSKDIASTYTSSISCSNNRYLSIEFSCQPKILGTTGIAYHVTVKDSRGLTYYLYNMNINKNKPERKQKCCIVAVQDQYGNMIRYEHEDTGTITKIIDTYGHEINISKTTNGKQISYYDDAECKTKVIKYENEKLPSSELNNDSMFKDKPISRFTVTNEIGEKTIYDSREGHASAYYTRQSGKLDDITNPDEEVFIYSKHNIERIIYPSGAEERYRYKYISPINGVARTRRGVYAVEDSYSIVDNQRINHISYEISGKYTLNQNMCMTITAENSDVGSKTISEYDAEMDLILETVSKDGTTNSTPYIKKKYKYRAHQPINCTIDNNGVISNTEYEYIGPATLSSVSRDDRKIYYTYHTVNNKLTDMPKTISTQYKSGTNWVTDYMETTELTSDNKSVAKSKVLQNNVVKSQKVYSYDAEGNVISIKQWTQDTNGDGVLDDSDNPTILNTPVTVSENKTASVIKYADNVKDIDGTDDGRIFDMYEFNMYGSPTAHTDSYGTKTTISYDDLNRPVSYQFPNGSEKTVEYNLPQRYITVTDRTGIKTKIIYDQLGRITAKRRIGSSDRLMEYYTYDSAGRVKTETNYRDSNAGTRVTYEYNLLNQIAIKRVEELPAKALYTESYSYGYNKNDNTVTVSKRTVAYDGSKAAFVQECYDNLGRLIKTTSNSGSTVITTNSEYDYLDRCIKQTDAKGNSTAFEYDYAGNITKQTDAMGYSVENVYDMAGQLAQTIDAKGNSTHYTYDNLGRKLQVQAPFQNNNTSITKYYYDKNSRLTKEAEKFGGNRYHSQEYKYDIMGNTVGVINAASATQYQYNDAGQLTQMITGLDEYSENPTGGAVTQYEYDAFGNLSQLTDPMGLTEQYKSYDYQGNLLSKTDKNGKKIKNTYGTYGLMSAVVDYNDWINEDKKSYTYDNLGRVVKTVSQDADKQAVEEQFSYDGFGRITSSTSDNGDVQQYAYDENSNLTRYILLSDGDEKNTVSYTYSKINQLTSMLTDGRLTMYRYDENGNIVSKSMGNGVNTLYEYNDANLLVSMKNRKSGTVTREYECSYHLNGLKNQEVERNEVSFDRVYSYDRANRLTGETYHSSDYSVYSGKSYTYDNFGNRIKEYNDDYTKGKIREIYDYTYDLNNRMTGQSTMHIEGALAQTGPVTEERKYYYDNNGNTIAEQIASFTGDGEETSQMALSGRSGEAMMKLYTYNGFNQLVGYADGMNYAEYQYNANGLRTKKTLNHEITNFTWNGANLAKEQTGEVVNTYSYDITGIHSADMNGTVNAYIKDTHGSVIGVTDDTGVIVNNYEYDAFGVQISGDSVPNPFGYCGEYLDNESGLIYLRNRYYNSETGRFITEDSIKDGLNWYIYCGNNPVSFVDPLGLNSVMVEAIMKKNGGIVNWDAETQTLIVGMPNSDKTLSFKMDQTQNINGNMIVDHQLLMDTFGFTYEQANHLDGDLYDRPEDAALAFGLVYNWFSTDRTVEGYSNGREYVATIVGEGDKYKYVNVQEGEGDKAKLSISNNMVAWVHTHGAYRSPNDWASDVFSGFDKERGGGDGYVSYKTGCMGFLITPGGALVSITSEWFSQKLSAVGGNLDDPRIKVADNNDSGVSILGYGIPHQPKGW